MRRPVRLAVGALAAAAVVVAPATASTPAAKVPKRVPISNFTSSQFGKVLADRQGQALYYWNKETRARIRCTGSCARAWPVVYVPNGVSVPRRIRGYRGVFGTVRRPDNGRRQLTWNNRPVYSYANERPREVKCDNVDKWFVVRLSAQRR
jgi:predicted lipoprotein with Yx(FWY)xxD motif